MGIKDKSTPSPAMESGSSEDLFSSQTQPESIRFWRPELGAHPLVIESPPPSSPPFAYESASFEEVGAFERSQVYSLLPPVAGVEPQEGESASYAVWASSSVGEARSQPSLLQPHDLIDPMLPEWREHPATPAPPSRTLAPQENQESQNPQEPQRSPALRASRLMSSEYFAVSGSFASYPRPTLQLTPATITSPHSSRCLSLHMWYGLLRQVSVR